MENPQPHTPLPAKPGPENVAVSDSPTLEAPWLESPTEWSIRRSDASSLRPGVFCFAPSRQAFLRVVAVTHLRGQDDLIFVDLSDGRSLKLTPSDEVFVRITGDPQ